MNTQWAEVALLAPRRRTSRSQELADLLRRRIVSGDLPVGGRLPSIRKLARLHAVSIPTAHAAIQCLVSLGFVQTVHGVGTFVGRPTHGAAALNHAWLNASPTELVAMRAAIDERVAVWAAVMVRNSDEAGRPVSPTLSLIQLLANERASSRFGYVESFVVADRRFHQAVAAALRGIEIIAAVRERVDRRLGGWWLMAAPALAADRVLDDAHVELAACILDGRTRATASLARRIAARESDAVVRAAGAGIR